MATKTASVSGDWSNTATWGGAAVPTAGDDVVIGNSSNTITVVINDAADALIDIGSDGGSNDALDIKSGSKVRLAKSAADALLDPTVDHTLRLRGHLNIEAGGELHIGDDTTNGQLPQARKFIFELNYSGTPGRAKYGVKWSGVWSMRGFVRDSQACRDLLAVTASSGQQMAELLGNIPTTWNVVPSGAGGDQVILSATDTTPTHHEVRGLYAKSGATLTLSSNLSYAHTGSTTSEQRGELINVERNIILRAGNGGSADILTTTANTWYLTMAATATGDQRWCRYQDLTYNANDAWCDYIGTTLGNIRFECGMFVNIDRGLFRCRAAAGTGLAVIDCSVFNVIGGNNADCVIISTTSAAATTVPYDFTGLWVVGNQSTPTSKGFSFVNHRYSKIAGSRISGMYTGFIVNTTSATSAIPVTPGLYDNLNCHSNRNDGMDIGSIYAGAQYDITGWASWANASAGIGGGATGGTVGVFFCDCLLTDFLLNNNAGAAAAPFYSGVGFRNVRMLRPKIQNNVTGWIIGDATAGLLVVDGEITGNTGDDLAVAAGACVDADFVNCLIDAVQTLSGAAAWRPQRLRLQRLGQTTDYKVATNLGVIDDEATTVRTSPGLSWKFTPKTLTGGQRLRSDPLHYTVNGGAPATISVWTAKDAAYNGAHQTLRVLGGMVQGVAEATATAALAGAHTPPEAGDWELLEVEVNPTEAGIIEVVYECDGSAGAVYFDDAGGGQ